LTFVSSSIIQSSIIDSILMNTLTAKIVDLKKKMKNSSSIIQSSFIDSTFVKTLIVKINDLKNKLKNVSSNQIVKLKKRLLKIENKINVLKNALNECVNRMNNATFNIMTISTKSIFRQNNDTNEFDLNSYLNEIVVWLNRDFVWWLIVK
jgi:seryl-tRNA synthetase